MNNFKKIGVSALAGSLAMVSANAVEYTVSGDFLATFSTADSLNNPTESGKGFGADTDLYFSTSGELDNGYTVGYVMSVNTNGALTNSSSQMVVGMGSFGSLHLNHVGGSKVNAIDDVMPHAYEETWHGITAASSDPSFFGGTLNSGSIDYRIPAQEYSGITLNASVTYDPNAQSVGANDAKGVGATTVSGRGAVIQLASDFGLEIGAGITIEEDNGTNVAGSGGLTEEEAVTAYIKYAYGPISVGYQEAYKNAGHGSGTLGRDTSAEFMGVAYTAGDFTVSYGESSLITEGNISNIVDPEIELNSLQAAYTMGAMTVAAAMSETTNASGISAKTYNENTLAVAFAF